MPCSIKCANNSAGVTCARSLTTACAGATDASRPSIAPRPARRSTGIAGTDFSAVLQAQEGLRAFEMTGVGCEGHVPCLKESLNTPDCVPEHT